MGKLNHHHRKESLAALSALMCASLSLAADPAAPKPPAAPAPAAEEKHPIEPTRYGGGDLPNYILTITGIMHAGSRTMDPFGLYQDPDAKPVTRRPLKGDGPVELPVPLADIISQIRITTIIANERKFLVGSRVFSEGEQFPINFRGKTIPIQIVEVSAQQVQFKNISTGETASRRLDLLPPGMTAGGSGSAPPGMVPTNPDAPLVIEPEASVPLNEPSR